VAQVLPLPFLLGMMYLISPLCLLSLLSEKRNISFVIMWQGRQGGYCPPEKKHKNTTPVIENALSCFSERKARG
jgi:hypothetical protein